jgi:hypothetical protein
MKTHWKNQKTVKYPLYFSDLSLKDSFRIKGGRNAVYTKVIAGTNDVIPGHYSQEVMFEIETGKLFKPTLSEVELVDVEVTIGTELPDLYRTKKARF